LCCGCNGHYGDWCKIYPDQSVVSVMCNTCNQGFHTVCRSKRFDLKVDFLNKQIKQLSELYAALQSSQQNSNASNDLSDGDSD